MKSLVKQSQWSISLLLVCFLIGQVILTRVSTGNQDRSNLKIKEATEHCQNCYPNVIVKTIHNVENIYSTGNEANVATASNEGKGGFQIPSNHPIITTFKNPHLVEGIKYYSDSPAEDAQVEAVSIQKTDENYYKPFKNHILIKKAQLSSECEDIDSMFLCKDMKLCEWDDNIKKCVFNKPRPINNTDDNQDNQENSGEKQYARIISNKNINSKTAHVVTKNNFRKFNNYFNQ